MKVSGLLTALRGSAKGNRVRNQTSVWHSFIFPILGYFRRRRGRFLLSRFPEVRTFSICDLGGSEHFWDELSIGISRKRITLYNISRVETQGLNTNSEHSDLVLYDGRRVPVEDGAFDLCICNSVIEHVPPEQREQFAREIMRVGRRIFVQTPAFEFPFEPHFLLPFLHWLPKPLGYWLACISPWRILSWASTATVRAYYFGTHLLTRDELRKLFPGCSITSERFLFFAKSHYVIRGVLTCKGGTDVENLDPSLRVDHAIQTGGCSSDQ